MYAGKERSSDGCYDSESEVDEDLTQDGHGQVESMGLESEGGKNTEGYQRRLLAAWHEGTRVDEIEKMKSMLRSVSAWNGESSIRCDYAIGLRSSADSGRVWMIVWRFIKNAFLYHALAILAFNDKEETSRHEVASLDLSKISEWIVCVFLALN